MSPLLTQVGRVSIIMPAIWLAGERGLRPVPREVPRELPEL